jgi:DNA-binding protein HU-beta
MNKSDLIDEVSAVMNSKKDAKKAVDCLLSAISGSLNKRDSVTLVGFGTFKVAERKARTGRNPQTGKKMKIEAKSVPKFVPGKALKDAVN